MSWIPGRDPNHDLGGGVPMSLTTAAATFSLLPTFKFASAIRKHSTIPGRFHRPGFAMIMVDCRNVDRDYAGTINCVIVCTNSTL